MFLHLFLTSFSRLNVNSISRRLILPILLAGLLSGCSSQPAFQSNFDQAQQPVENNKLAENTPEQPVTQTDLEPLLEPDKGRKPACNRPYRVRGKTYYPMHSAKGYSAKGFATWYGSEKGHHHTASGHRFNPKGFSAAHKTLPIPSKVRVTNLSNGRYIDVVINDRGPFNEDTLIDLSKGAAEEIDMRGQTEVKIEYLGT